VLLKRLLGLGNGQLQHLPQVAIELFERDLGTAATLRCKLLRTRGLPLNR
jgi:hypothetical protein